MKSKYNSLRMLVENCSIFNLSVYFLIIFNTNVLIGSFFFINIDIQPSSSIVLKHTWYRSSECRLTFAYLIRFCLRLIMGQTHKNKKVSPLYLTRLGCVPRSDFLRPELTLSANKFLQFSFFQFNWSFLSNISPFGFFV